jgi:hypothetical protein
MEAGVRQGCPLAPLLYLFVAKPCCMCWLRSQEVGVRLQQSDPDRNAACQFADDTEYTEAVIQGEESVAPFLAAMDTFTRASGQRLNLDKVELLWVGSGDAVASAACCGGDRATARGCTMTAAVAAAAAAAALDNRRAQSGHHCHGTK